MHIQEVRIQNFRVFGDEGISFTFNKGINVVIGENNNGKTALIDAIRIAFSCALYKKDIFFSKTDFHVNAAGKKATSAQIDVYLKDVPQNLIEIGDPIQPDCGEFHVVFTLEKTPSGTDKVKYRAWGGKCEGNPLSADTLEAINLAYLSALRDATNEMKPSRNSKLAELLETIAKKPEDKEALVDKLRVANQEILQTESLGKTKQVINENLFSIEQNLLHQKVDLGLVEPRFESIMASLRSWIIPRWYFMGDDHQNYAQVKELERSSEYKVYIHNQECGLYVDVDSLIAKKQDLDGPLKDALLALKNHSFEIFQNGLGYNNLLFISAVLGDMSFAKSGIYTNLFLVEEPEAHLHPQLQELILNFFSKKVQQHENIQVIMTSHSPTLVSKIGIKNINLLYESQHKLYNYPLIKALLTDEENDYLEKYLDVTKSQLFFAKGVIFVEGISEAILVPEFAKLIDRPLDMYAVELVNINGVGFAPFTKMIKVPGQNAGFAKASIITDDDRCSNKKDSTYISKDLDFDDDLTGLIDKIEQGAPSDRFNSITALCSDNIVKCFGAVKTLEYALALEPNNIACDISFSPDKVAIVTRGRIHSDNSIDNLWKTPETELLARASFEWMCGNRKKAYSFCEKALFQLIIKDSKDIDVSIERDVSQIMPYAQWKQVVIEILIRLPSANEQCGQWVTNSRVIVHEMLTAHNMSLRNGATITDSIKIKTRDTQNPDFKRIPIKDYFEIRSQTEYTRSSVHGVKGETFDALMLLIHGTRGKTLTPSFLTNGNTDTELMRIAYVAMTRPRKLLVVAMPKSTAQLETRFSKEKWDYVEV